jgi:hypothetical protein
MMIKVKSDSRRLLMRAAIAASLVLGLGTAWAGQPPAPTGLEVGSFEPQAWVTRDGMQIDSSTGFPRAIYDPAFRVRPGAPEDQAREYLRAAAPNLGLLHADLADLRHHATRTGASGSTLRFRQMAGGLPVLGAELTVTINSENRVVFVASSYQPLVAIDRLEPELDAAAARAIAYDHLEVEGPVLFESTELAVFQDGSTTRLVHRVVTAPERTPRGEWEVLVDAVDGTVVRAADIALYAPVDGNGNAFDPDPLSSAHATYGDPGYVDGGDADTPELTAESFDRVLPGITENAGMYELRGPYAYILDWDSPYKGIFSQASPTFTFTRQADAFEAVNGYYHIDTFMRYANENLGVNVMPYHYATGVVFDPSGWNGADNSSYSPSTGRLTFGEGGVDDAEDADVLLHELGHGLHDWVTHGGLSQVQGLSEGVGDYIAASYSRAFGQWAPADPQYHWVFSWDGHNPFWPGRITNWVDTHPWPTGLTGDIYLDGMIWSGCMMRVWDAVGREPSDRALLVGLGMTNGGSNQDVAAHAVLQAAQDLGYPSDDVIAIATALSSCGYTVEIPGGPLFEDGFESGDATAWSSVVP